MFGINVSNLIFRIKINPVKQPIQSNSVGSWRMSHCWTSSFNYHFDHGFVVFEHIQQSFLMRRLDVWGNTINVQLRLILRRMCVGTKSTSFNCSTFCLLLTFWILVLEWGVAPVSWMLWCVGSTLLLVERSSSITMSQRSRAGNPSIPNPASRENISDSVELCEREVCFLHIQLTGRNVLLPKKYTRHLLRLILSPQSHQQSLSLETHPVCNAVPCFTHDNTVGNRSCDELRNRSCEPSVTCVSPFGEGSCKLVDRP